MYAEVKDNNKILINRLNSNEKILVEDLYNNSILPTSTINVTKLTDESGDFGGIFLNVETTASTSIARVFARKVEMNNNTDLADGTICVVYDGVKYIGSFILQNKVWVRLDESEAKTYNIISNLTHTTSSNTSDTINEGEDFNTTLTADEGYSLPQSITVTIGDTEAVQGNEYTYDVDSGTLSILSEYIDGDITYTVESILDDISSVGNILNNVLGTSDEITELGGTEEEIIDVFDDILGNN